MNISGGKKDPETLRREAICEALESLLEKEGSQEISLPVAKVSETSDPPDGFLADGKSKARVTGLRGLRGKDCRGVNPTRGQEGKGEMGSNGECLEGGKTSEKDGLKPVSRGRGLNRRGRGFSRQT